MAFIEITADEVLPDALIKATTHDHVRTNLDYLYDEKLKMEGLLWASLTF